MAQDFAKQRSNPDGIKRKRAVSAVTKGPPPAAANWSWFFSGLMAGVIISIATYLGVLKLEENVAESAQSAQAGITAEDQPTYTFYEELSRAEVPVDLPPPEGTAAVDAAAQPATNVSDATSPTPPPVTIATQSPAATTEEKAPLYLVQAGSFQNREDGESHRARIILLNMNANVVESVVGGRTRYRVQVGPFAGRENAEGARDILSSNEIDSILMVVPQ
jgi:cell division protein FtsN